tara:strand:- start:253 stop:546 length:294 start_codon:yes stop_codon:yes gene_type:complete
MKTYNNGPRKRMMYGGMAKNKPMMNGGMATKKKPRKKAQAGGMMTSTMTQNERQNKRMGMNPMMPGMAGGGEAKLKMVKNKEGNMVPFYAADGKGKS